MKSWRSEKDLSYDLTTRKEGDILRVTAEGTRSLDSILAMSNDILTICIEKNVNKVLIDVRALTGRLILIDAYEIPTLHFPEIRSRGVISHAAIVDLEEFKDSYRFFETVAVNQGFRLRIFSDPDVAIVWLKE